METILDVEEKEINATGNEPITTHLSTDIDAGNKPGGSRTDAGTGNKPWSSSTDIVTRNEPGGKIEPPRNNVNGTRSYTDVVHTREATSRD